MAATQTAPPQTGPMDVISQLNTARKLALRNSTDYVQLLSGVLPVVTPSADLSLRRWGADFLAEAFCSPHIPNTEKEKLAPSTLGVLRALLSVPKEDADLDVQKHSIQAASCLYSLVVRYCATNPNDSTTWNLMIDVKNLILALLDSGSIGVRMCCIKFCHRVILAQTPVQVDPRIQHLQTDVSLSVIPRTHPFLNSRALEQEAMVLLDRLMTILLDISTEIVILTALMNCLGALVRARPTLLDVVIETALLFRPFAGVQKALSPSSHVAIRSIERTTKLMFKSIITKYPASPHVPKMKEFIMKLERSHVELLEQASRKRSAPSEELQQDSDSKRQRVRDPSTEAGAEYPPLPDGPISLAQLVTLTPDVQITSFDVKILPAELVSVLLVPLLQSIDEKKLSRAIQEIQRRCHIRNSQPAPATRSQGPKSLSGPNASPDMSGDDEEEDFYEPTFPPAPSTNNTQNNLQTSMRNGVVDGRVNGAVEEEDDDGDDLYDPAPTPTAHNQLSTAPAGSISRHLDSLPHPQILPPDVAASIGSIAVDKVLARIATLSSKNPDWKPGSDRFGGGGFGNLPSSGDDRKSWVVFLARLATRADNGLDPDDFVDPDAADDDDDFSYDALTKQDVDSDLIASKIRDGLLHYVLKDFRQHIDLAASWLSEEWLNDKVRLEEYQKKMDSLTLDTDTENLGPGPTSASTSVSTASSGGASIPTGPAASTGPSIPTGLAIPTGPAATAGRDSPDTSTSPGRGASKHQKRKWRRQRKQRLLKLHQKQRLLPPPRQNYKHWTIKLIDGILPFLESRDKVLIRLLSVLPMLDPEILSRVQKLAEDPERVGLCTQALQYLIMLRTPVRDMCLDIVEDLYKNYEDARPSAKKILVRWRPASLKEKGHPLPAAARGARHTPVLVDRSEATTPGDGLPWD